MRGAVIAAALLLSACDGVVDRMNAMAPDASVRDRAIDNLIFQTDAEPIAPFNRRGAACIADAATDAELQAMATATSRGEMLRVIEPIRTRPGVPECQIDLLSQPITLEPI